MDTELNQNAGDAGQGFSPNTDQGGGGANPGQPSNPAGAGSQDPASWETERQRLIENNRALNRALVEAKRGGQQRGTDPQNGEDPYSTPQGQYALALQVATGQVREKLEDIVGLYPEVDQKIISQIRKNPWAFASHQSYVNGDVASAALEIEQYIADAVEASAGAAPGNQTPARPAQPTPASVNANPAPDPSQDGGQGGEEDFDPWTAPMDQLEKEAAKAKRKLQAQG